MEVLTHDEAQLVCYTKEAIRAMGNLVLFLNRRRSLLPTVVYDRIVEADYLLNSAEDYYINDAPEEVKS